MDFTDRNGSGFVAALLTSLFRQWQQAGGDLSQLPGETAEQESLRQLLARRHAALWRSMLGRLAGQRTAAIVEPDPGDRRFGAPEWSESLYHDYLRQAYLLNAEFLNAYVKALAIKDQRLKRKLGFFTRQYIEAMSPANFVATNPECVREALNTGGESIVRGLSNLLADIRKGRMSTVDESAFRLGENIATTAGAVIYQNELMQLIQYAPLTDRVASKPLLIVPPCINRFYILDLSPENSFVRFVVEQGFTVFLVSWKNPGPEQADAGWDDYVGAGVLQALEIVRKLTRVRRPNVLGFCIGGTLLACALAVLKAQGRDEVASLTLLATLLDYSETGELGCLIDEALLDELRTSFEHSPLVPASWPMQLFAALRANDMIWSRVADGYLKGLQAPALDLLFWNADGTNLPGRFTQEYLRHLYLENRLARPGGLQVLGCGLKLSELQVPAYVFAAESDHIVPWQTAYASARLLGGETTFVLGAGGHVAGMINPASRNRKHYRAGPADIDGPELWRSRFDGQRGSWWLHWIKWLRSRSGRQIAARGRMGNARFAPMQPAPGSYVREPSSDSPQGRFSA